MASHRKSLNIYQVVLFGVLGALTFALKFSMAALPNIEPVSLMIILMTVLFGWKALFPTYLYVALEILVYGLGTWNICYLYVWPVLFLCAMGFRKMKNPLGWAILSGAFGLMFGALCGIVDLFIGGFAYAITKWMSGIPFDLAHCCGNFVIALLLFTPLHTLLQKLYRKA